MKSGDCRAAMAKCLWASGAGIAETCAAGQEQPRSEVASKVTDTIVRAAVQAADYLECASTILRSTQHIGGVRVSGGRCSGRTHKQATGQPLARRLGKPTLSLAFRARRRNCPRRQAFLHGIFQGVFHFLRPLHVLKSIETQHVQKLITRSKH